MRKHTRSRVRGLAAIGFAVVALLFGAMPADAGNAKQDSPALDAGTFDVVGETYLTRTTNGISAQFSVDAPAGHMMTAWFVVFNNPEACTTSPGDEIKCGEPDIFITPGVVATVTRVTGSVTGNGTFQGAGHASVGKAPVGADRLEYVFNHYGVKTNTALTNPMGAEIHLVFENHGPLDPAQMPGEIQLAGAEVISFALYPTP